MSSGGNRTNVGKVFYLCGLFVRGCTNRESAAGLPPQFLTSLSPIFSKPKFFQHVKICKSTLKRTQYTAFHLLTNYKIVIFVVKEVTMGKTDRIREDFIALIDEYFFNPVDDNFSAREALKSMPKDRQMDAMIRLTHILPKPKQEIDLGIFTKSEMFILGKDGKALDE